MQFQVPAILLLATGLVQGRVIEERGVNLEARMALIATTPFWACNCPNNCEYSAGHSCKFYSGPSTDSAVTSGTCKIDVNDNNKLTCQA